MSNEPILGSEELGNLMSKFHSGILMRKMQSLCNRPGTGLGNQQKEKIEKKMASQVNVAENVPFVK